MGLGGRGSRSGPRGAVRVTVTGYPPSPISTRPGAWARPDSEQFVKFFRVMNALAGGNVGLHCAGNMRVSAFITLSQARPRRERRGRVISNSGDVESSKTWLAFISPICLARDRFAVNALILGTVAASS